MRQHTPYTPPAPSHILPIVCPACGSNAGLMRRTPDPDQLSAEIQTFECAECGRQTEIRVPEEDVS